MGTKKNSIFGVTLLLFPLFISISYAQITWERNPNPVLNPGPSGSWDDSGVSTSSVLFVGNEYKMWYMGKGGVGYASSPDGIVWTKSQANPVLLPGIASAWDGGRIAHVSVLFVNGTYQMWYNGVDGLNDNRIGYATSPDGIRWTKYAANPVVDLGSAGAWDDHEVMHPYVLLDGSTYRMYYNGFGNQLQRIGLATSTDGIKWTKHPANPLLAPGPLGAWDDDILGPLCVLPSQNLYLMWYFALSRNGIARVGYATSTDWIHWTKYPSNPVLSAGAVGAWDDGGVAHPIVLFRDSVYKMWYSGLHGSFMRIGYASSRNVISGVEESPGSQLQFTLGQNYPNPFNPSTTISYSLPKSSTVTLTIFNALGQGVASLVNERKEAGRHQVTWDAADVPSGVYFYHLQVRPVDNAPAWEVTQTKKLVLVR